MTLLTFSVYDFPFFCHPSGMVDDDESQRVTVRVPIQVLRGHVHILLVLADVLHRVDQGGAVVIDVFNCDNNSASDGFSRRILKIRKKKIYIFWLYC